MPRFVLFSVFAWLLFVLLGWPGLVIAAAAPYWLIPIVMRYEHRIPAHPDFEPLSGDGREIPDWARTLLDETAASLATVGYTSAGTFVYSSPRTAESAVTLFRDQQRGRLAVVMAGWSRNSPGAPRARVLELTARLGDGESIVTTNARQPRLFAAVRGKRVVQLPEVRDPATLHAAHRALVERDGRREQFVPYDDARPTLRAAAARDLADQRTAGYLHLDVGADLFRPTWRGAFAMTWRRFPPTSWILQRQTRRTQNVLLEQLGPGVRGTSDEGRGTRDERLVNHPRTGGE